jgi:hypothetical protein
MVEHKIEAQASANRQPIEAAFPQTDSGVRVGGMAGMLAALTVLAIVR